MNHTRIIISSVAVCGLLGLVGCDDDLSGIGSSIFSSEVDINVDSRTYSLMSSTVDAPSFATRSDYTMLGMIDVNDYGRLECSYVTQLLPAESVSLPEDVTPEDVDSVKLILTMPRSSFTGDSVAPQQVTVYPLTKSLPDDISYTFNPEGYYDSSAPLGVRTYTLSGTSQTQTTYSTSSTVDVMVHLDRSIGVDVLQAYADDPGLFTWPADFAKKYPGLYVTNTFGSGCVAAISSSKVWVYYPVPTYETVTDDDGNETVQEVAKADSICVFSSAPEVLSSINVSYQPAQQLRDMITSGRHIITTPGGYVTRFRFPAREILAEYWSSEYNLGVINNLTFSIPASVIANKYGIGVPPTLLMVKTSELDEFFSEGKVPDNKTSFYSIYTSSAAAYEFNSMRQYIVDLRAKGEENITDDDLDFTLVPVTIRTDEMQISGSTTTQTVVTSVTPYVIRPSMVELFMEKAEIIFTYSNQIIK